ncbi:MarR family winged helix-turn-helix transcriptional regulator [Secundilactobacillus malefermentans]|uniref:MarR family winged helix-turn-helix transcriptional regulator n=1 Tax=Secundilactobacillus malefermentans TaxID=176292 RepID=UPI0011CCC9D6|nr:MarR family transcriptional regulator [Secundilactobacillus malefermentans]QEA31491.1 MarR family transcriptional regulator [Secundilactobacillus malefermentans]
MQYHHFSQYIAGIYRRSKNDFNHQIEALDVHATQSDLLMFIYEHPGRQQVQIAQEMSVDPSLLARDLTVLAKKGWVTRTPATTDRRAKVVALTVAGEALAQELTETMAKWWQSLFNELADFDVDDFDTKLTDIYNVLLKRDRP